ncbi:hypothetical protein BJX99DRAFT_248388 [Aspergillus californicus]
MENPEPAPKKPTIVSNILHLLVAGNPDDVLPSPQQVLDVVSILLNTGILCCVVQTYALIYYGAPRLASDRVVCVPDQDHERVLELFNFCDDILQPCGPCPTITPTLLNHKYPRFKAIGRLDFWLLVPESYCHLSCKPDNIVWSLDSLTDTQWLEDYYQAFREDFQKKGVDEMFIFIDPTPTPRQDVWQY